MKLRKHMKNTKINNRIILVSPLLENSFGGMSVWTEHYLEISKTSGNEVFLVNTMPKLML